MAPLSLELGGHDARGPTLVEQALQIMEAWAEGEEHMAKLSINALVGLFAKSTAAMQDEGSSN